MRLRWQLALTLATLAAGAATTASLAAYQSTSTQLASETDAFLQERLGEIIEFDSFINGDGPNFGPFGNDNSPGFGGPRFPFVRPDANTTYLNQDGTTRAALATTDIPIAAADRTIAQSATGQETRNVTIDDRHYRVLTAPLANGDPSAGAVQLSRDTTEANNLLTELRWRLTAITITVIATAAALGWAIARRLAKPLEHLRNAAAAVAETKTFDSQLPTDASGEVGEVTTSFNTMLAELDESRRRQHQLVQDANHELRTPLATLSANLELLDRTPPDSPERASILHEARTELSELTNLTEQLTATASIQYNPSARTTTTLEHIANTAIDQFRATSERQVDTDIRDPATITAAPDVLTRAVFNLLTNADKHAPSGTPIQVTIDNATLVVRDHGPGIAADDLPHIFEPFYRAASARTLPGSGLGLALVKQILDDHQATITPTNHPEGGAQFTLQWRQDPGGNPST